MYIVVNSFEAIDDVATRPVEIVWTFAWCVKPDTVAIIIWADAQPVATHPSRLAVWYSLSPVAVLDQYSMPASVDHLCPPCQVVRRSTSIQLDAAEVESYQRLHSFLKREINKTRVAEVMLRTVTVVRIPTNQEATGSGERDHVSHRRKTLRVDQRFTQPVVERAVDSGATVLPEIVQTGVNVSPTP